MELEYLLGAILAALLGGYLLYACRFRNVSEGSMTANGWLQILVYSFALLAATKPLGLYMYRVFEGDRQPLPHFFGPIERFLYRCCGIDEKREQDWKEYTQALLLFSIFGVLATYAIQRLQGTLPFNPQGLGAVSADSSFNTAVSFATNTDWQGYAGEATMSYLTQMAALAWHNFTSAAAGIGVALVLARGITRPPAADGSRGVGNFWVDLMRGILYLLLPLSIVFGLLLISQGLIQNLSPYVEVMTLEGARQTLAMGPVGSQEVIKELGTNGGGSANIEGRTFGLLGEPRVNVLLLNLALDRQFGARSWSGSRRRNRRPSVLRAQHVRLAPPRREPLGGGRSFGGREVGRPRRR